MHIGNVALETPFLLAPLAGQTDSPMRLVCRRRGASMVWTEMVSAEGLVRDGGKSFRLLAFREEERPIAAQLFGKRPEAMAGAASRAAALGPDVLDINAGCPAKKVVNGGSGSALMKEPELLCDIARAVVEVAGRPVTVKLRSGWDEESVNAVEVAAALEACGIAAIALHPRTRAQGFRGRSDWSLIAEVRRAVSVPVIGSGDVRTPEDAVRMLDSTNCDAVMIGRGAVGNPWLFAQAEALRSGGAVPPPPGLDETLRTAVEQLDLMVEVKGERRGVREMRKHLVAYLRGFQGASALRAELVRLEGHAEVRERLESAAYEWKLSGAVRRSEDGSA